MRSGQIKILNANDKLSEVINNVKLYEGITDVTVNNDILSYYIDEWASDYDIMVAVMNALEEAGIDSEPYFDDDITNSTNETVNVVEDSDENEDNDAFMDEEDADFPALEEELEIALEAAHKKQQKKNRLITGISAGVALLGVAGLATGLAIHSYFKKK